MIEWFFDAVIALRIVSLNNGKLILSGPYLQKFIPFGASISRFNVVIDKGTDTTMLFPMQDERDIEGNTHFILDASLSKRYFVSIACKQ